MLMKSTPSVNFINVLHTAFTLVGPKSVKRHWWLNCIFLHFRDLQAQKLYIKCWWNWPLVSLILFTHIPIERKFLFTWKYKNCFSSFDKIHEFQEVWRAKANLIILLKIIITRKFLVLRFKETFIHFIVLPCVSRIVAFMVKKYQYNIFFHVSLVEI